jgi:hypothetical protein
VILAASLLLKSGLLSDLQTNKLHTGYPWSDLYHSCIYFRWVDTGTPWRNYHAQHCACSRQKNNAICLVQNTLRLRHHTVVSRYYEQLLLRATRFWLEDVNFKNSNNASSDGRRRDSRGELKSGGPAPWGLAILTESSNKKISRVPVKFSKRRRSDGRRKVLNLETITHFTTEMETKIVI